MNIRSALAATILLTCLAVGLLVPSASQRLHLGSSSRSGIFLGTEILEGRIPVTHARNAQMVETELSCNPVPCTLSNVSASPKGWVVSENPIAVDPTNENNLITGANDLTCQSVLAYFVTTDGGKKWSGGCGAIAPGAVHGFGDPVVGYDLHGNVYQGGINLTSDGSREIVVAKSTDHGKTWALPVVATQIPSLLGDKPWLQADTNPNSPFANRIYVSSTQFDANSNTYIYVAYSADSGSTWTNVVASPEALSPNVVEGSDIAVGSDGTVYLSYMYCHPHKGSTDCADGFATMYVTKSKDGGATWSTPVATHIERVAPPGGCPYYGCLPNTVQRVPNIPVIAIDNSNGPYAGRLYVVDYDWTGTFMQIRIAQSSDGGDTWSKPVSVTPRTDRHDQFMPWVSVSTSGLVGVTWLDRRNDPNNINYQAFAAVSTDGGKTFPSNQQLATVASNPFDDGLGGGALGDYRCSTWVGAKKLVVAWPDTRNNKYARDEIGGLEQ